MKNKTLIISIITSLVFILMFTYFLVFQYDTYDIPNKTFLGIKEREEPGAALKYIEWDLQNSRESEETFDMDLFSIVALLLNITILAENASIRSSDVYRKYKNKKLRLASIVNLILILVLNYTVLYFSDYYRFYMSIMPMLLFPMDTLIISTYTLYKCNSDKRRQANI